MAEITLEKIDLIRERTGVSYTEAKEALENTEGNVVDALVYLEGKAKSKGNAKINELYATKDEFSQWLKDVINKGNVSRIKIKKDDKVVVDVPVNAGIAAGIFALIWPPLIALGILTAVFTKVTVEITKDDGSVEVVNTIIKNAVNDVKSKVNDIKDDVKEKVNDTDEAKKEENVYKYTVKFEDVNKEENDEK
jgi:hypothetical protein